MRTRADPADWFDRADIERARAYSRRYQRHIVATGIEALVILVGAVVLRVPTHLVGAVGARAWPLEALLVLGVLSAALVIVDLPNNLAETRLKRSVGYHTGMPLWRAELDDAFGSIVFISLAGTVVWGIFRATQFWWVILVVALFILATVAVGRAPSSKGMDVLPDEAERRVRRLVREAGLQDARVLVGPKVTDPRLPEVNTRGRGRNRVFVVARNVLDRPLDELEVLLAGPISTADERKRARRVMKLFGLALLVFLPAEIVLRVPSVRAWSGMSGRADPAGIPVLVLTMFVCLFVAGFVYSADLRRIRRRWDRAALEFTRNPEAFERAVRGLYERTRNDLAPSLYQRLRSELPPPAERLAMAAEWRKAQRVAVLFTDLEESTRLVEQLGDERWYELLRDHNEILRSNVERHRGRELASAGDGFLFVFDDVGEALIAAIEVQRALAAYNAEHDVALNVRMGVHTGEVIRKEDRIVGREVHVAARVSSLAEGGQILVSGNVRDALEGSARFRFGPPRAVELKGLSGTFEVCEADWSLRSTTGVPHAVATAS
jgi:class 3 adenylate cyclase